MNDRSVWICSTIGAATMIASLLVWGWQAGLVAYLFYWWTLAPIGLAFDIRAGKIAAPDSHVGWWIFCSMVILSPVLGPVVFIITTITTVRNPPK